MSRMQIFKPFSSRMSSWSLCFVDPEHEIMYQEVMKSNMHIPLLFRLLTYMVFVLQFGYRCAALGSACGRGFMPTGTFREELGSLSLILVCLSLELLLRLTGRCRQLWGLNMYICFPIVTVAAAYYTQRAPRFGML